MRTKGLKRKLSNVLLLGVLLVIAVGIYYAIYNSLAENVIEIGAIAKDNYGYLEDEEFNLEAKDIGGDMYEIDLPESINEKVINKIYNVLLEKTETEAEQDENSVTDKELETEKEAETITEEKTEGQINNENQETEEPTGTADEELTDTTEQEEQKDVNNGEVTGATEQEELTDKEEKTTDAEQNVETTEQKIEIQNDKITLSKEQIESNKLIFEVSYDMAILEKTEEGQKQKDLLSEKTEEERAQLNITEETEVLYNKILKYEDKENNKIIELKGFLPKEAQLKVKGVTQEQLQEIFEDEKINVAYDITIVIPRLSEGGTIQYEEVNPEEFGETCQVSITDSKIEENSIVYHVKEDNTYEEVTVTESKEESVSFEADTFSIYAVATAAAVEDDLVTSPTEWYEGMIYPFSVTGSGTYEYLTSNDYIYLYSTTLTMYQYAWSQYSDPAEITTWTSVGTMITEGEFNGYKIPAPSTASSSYIEYFLHIKFSNLTQGQEALYQNTVAGPYRVTGNDEGQVSPKYSINWNSPSRSDGLQLKTVDTSTYTYYYSWNNSSDNVIYTQSEQTKLNAANVTLGTTAYGIPMPILDGIFYLHVTQYRNGNTRTAYYTFGPYYLDTTAPTHTVSPASETVDDASITKEVGITLSDMTSGMSDTAASVKFTWRTSKTAGGSTDYESKDGDTYYFNSINSRNGTYYLGYTILAYDKAGNEYSYSGYSGPYYLDNTPPTAVTEVVAPGWYNANDIPVTYTITGVSTDEHSGLHGTTPYTVRYADSCPVCGATTIGVNKDTLTFWHSHEMNGDVLVYAVDKAGNKSSAYTFKIQIDITKPVISNVTKNGMTVTVTASDPVGEGGADTVSGLASYSYDGGTTWVTDSSYTYPAGTATATIYVKDVAGNISDAWTIEELADIVPPNVTITADKTSPTNQSSLTYTIEFDEEVKDFESDDITVTNGTKGTFSGSGSTYTLVVDYVADGTQTVSVEQGKCTDMAGNPNNAGSASMTMDRTAPTVTSITASPTTKIGEIYWSKADSITYTITFSEDVNSFVVGDITVTNGTKGTFSGSGKTYTLEVTDTPATGTTQTIIVSSRVCRDAAGNLNTPAASMSVTMDKTAPTMSLSPNSGTAAQTHSTTLTISDGHSGVPASLKVKYAWSTNGTTAPTSGWSSETTVTNGTLTIKEEAKTKTGDYYLWVQPVTVKDNVGNSQTNNLTSGKFVFDNTKPSVTITANKTSPTNATSVTYTFTFSESVTGFTTDDITVSNGTKGTFSGSGSTYTLVVDYVADGTQKVSVAADVCTDTAGNKNTAGSKSITMDRTAPTVTSITASPVTTVGTTHSTNANSITYTFEFSEDIKDGTFEASDITVSNEGTKGTFTKVSASKYTLVVTNTVVDAIQTITVPAGVCTDKAGNSNLAGTISVIIDKKAPIMLLNPNNGAVAQTHSTNFMISDTDSTNRSGVATGLQVKYAWTTSNSTEPTTGWTTIDMSHYSDDGMLAGAVIKDETKTKTGDYYLWVKPVTVKDNAGNSQTETLVSEKFVFDNTKPSLTITANKTSPTNATSVTYTFTFSESVTGFTTDDITVSNGTKGTFSGSGSTYTLVVDYVADGTQKVSVAAGKCTDTAGNENTAASLSITMDRTPPNVTSMTASPKTTVGTTHWSKADSITYTIVFSESVTGFTTDDITVSNGTKGDFSGSGTTYTLVVTNDKPTGTVQKITVPAEKCQDAAGNLNTQAASISVTMDKTAPTMSLSPSSNSTWAKSHSVTITLSDPNSGLASGIQLQYAWQSETIATEPTSGWTTISVTGYTAGDKTATATVTGSGYTDGYKLWVKPVSDKFKDVVGNTNNDTKTSGVFNFDNKAPIIEFTPTKNETWAKSHTINFRIHDENRAGVDTSNYEIVYGWATSATGTATYDTENQNVSITANGDELTGTITEPGKTGRLYLVVKVVTLKDKLGNSITSGTELGRTGPFFFDNYEPQILIDPNSNNTWATKHKATVTIKDTHSKLADSLTLKYAWYTGETLPTDWETNTSVIKDTVTVTGGTDVATFEATTAPPDHEDENIIKGLLSNNYYLFIIPVDVQDKLGNKETLTNKSSGKFYVDTTGPLIKAEAVTTPGTWYKQHQVKVTVWDGKTDGTTLGAGLSAEGIEFSYAWTSGSEPGTRDWIEQRIEGHSEGDLSVTYTVSHTGVTGEYYFWYKMQGDSSQDSLGNTNNAVAATKLTDGFKFDNTQPFMSAYTVYTVDEDVYETNTEKYAKGGLKVVVTMKDAHSGLPAGSQIQYQWIKDGTTVPSSGWTTLTGDNTAIAETEVFTIPVSKSSSLNGNYKLYIKAGVTKDTVADSTKNTNAQADTALCYHDNYAPQISFSPNTYTTWSIPGKEVVVTIDDKYSGSEDVAGLPANISIQYQWATSSSALKTDGWTTLTGTNAVKAKSTTRTVPASASAGLTGTYYLYVKAACVSDNVITETKNTNSAKNTALFRYDNTKPTITVPAGPSGWKTEHSVTVTIADAHSKLAANAQMKYQWVSEDGTHKTDWVTVDVGNAASAASATFTATGSATGEKLTGLYDLVVAPVTLKDTAETGGNSQTASVTSTGTYYFDNTDPTVSLSPNTPTTGTRYVKGGVDITATLADAHAGLVKNAAIQYQWVKVKNDNGTDIASPTLGTWITANATNTAGASSATITIPASASSSLNGVYKLYINNGATIDNVTDSTTENSNSGNVKSALFYHDNYGPKITVFNPNSRETWYRAGQSVVVTIDDRYAEGSTTMAGLRANIAIHYQWAKSESALKTDGWTKVTGSNDQGAASTTRTVPALNVNEQEGGTYYLFIKESTVDDFLQEASVADHVVTQANVATTNPQPQAQSGKFNIDKIKPTISLNPNTQTTYTQAGAAVTVTIKDTLAGLAANVPIQYKWVSEDGTDVSGWNNLTGTNTAGAKSTTRTVPASASAGLTGKYYLYIKAGTVSDNVSDTTKNLNDQKVSGVFHFDNTETLIEFIPEKQDTEWTTGTAVTVKGTDNDSLLVVGAQIQYQWVKVGETASSSGWKTLTASNTTAQQTLEWTVPKSASENKLNGEYNLYIKEGVLKDVAGNSNQQAISGIFKFDNTKPNIELSVIHKDTKEIITPAKQTDYYSKGTAVTVTITDTLAGLAKDTSIQYQWATSSSALKTNEWKTVTGTNSAGTTSSITRVVPVDASSTLTGTYYLFIKSGSVRDNVTDTTSKNVNSQITSEKFYFDNAAPVITFSPNGTGTEWWTAGTTTVVISDGNSGLPNSVSIQYQWILGSASESSTWQTKTGTKSADGKIYIDIDIPQGTGEYKLCVNSGTFTDNAVGKINTAGTEDGSRNNNAKTTSSAFKMDNTRPTIDFSANEQTSWINGMNVTVRVKDANAGLAASQKIKYQWVLVEDSDGNIVTDDPQPSLDGWKEIGPSQLLDDGSIIDRTYEAGTTNVITYIVPKVGGTQELPTGKYILIVADDSVRDNVTDVTTKNYNAGESTTGLFWFDNTKPTVTIETPTSNWVRGGQDVTVTLSDSHGGIKAKTTVSYQWVKVKNDDGTAIASPTIGTYKTITTSNTTTQNSVTVEVPASDSASLNGYYALYIEAGKTYDTAGNTNAQKISGTFKFDNKIDSVATMTLKLDNSSGATYTSNTWTNHSVYIKLNNDAKDIHSGKTTNSGDNTTSTFTVKKGSSVYNSLENKATGTTYTLTETGTYTITVTTEDKAVTQTGATPGNKSTRTYTVKIDKEAPTIGTLTTKLNSSSGSNYTGEWNAGNTIFTGNWTNQSVYIKLNNGSDSHSGHKESKYSVIRYLNNNNYTAGTNGTNYTVTSDTLTESGIYVITVTTEDKSGVSYAETGNTTTNTYIIKIDKVNPTPASATINYTGATFTNAAGELWTKEDVKLTINDDASDDETLGGSGINQANYIYKVNGTQSTANLGEEITLTETGVYTVETTTNDHAGNTASETYTIRIDKETPVGETLIFKLEDSSGSDYQGAWDANDTTFTGVWTNYIVDVSKLTNSATDEHSGVKQILYTFYKNGELVLESEDVFNGLEIRFGYDGEDATNTIVQTTIDYVGNESTRTYIIKQDFTAPEIAVNPVKTSNPKTESTAEKSIDITISATDAGGSELKTSGNSYQYYLSTSKETTENGSWKNYTKTGSTHTIGTNLTGTYYLWVKQVGDTAGNKSAKVATDTSGNTTTETDVSGYHVFGPYVFDNSSPTITANPTSGEVEKKHNVTLTVAEVGDAGLIDATNNEDPNTYEYYLSESASSLTGGTEEWRAYTSGTAFTLETNKDGEKLTGTYYLLVRTVSDIVGNTSSTFGDIKTIGGTKYHMFGTYVLDNATPEITFTPNGSGTTWKQSQSTVVTVVDRGDAGIQPSTFRYLWLEEGATEPAKATFNSSGTTFASGDTITIDEVTGKYNLWVYVEDKKGNAFIAESELFLVDNTLPIIDENLTIKYDNASGDDYIFNNPATNGWTNHSVYIKAANGTDEHSGHNKTTCTIYKKNESGTFVAITEEGAESIDTTLTETGEYYVQIVTEDNAGNIAETTQDENIIRIDKVDPTIGAMQFKLDSSAGTAYTNDTWTKHDVWMKIANQGADSLSGLKSTVYNIAKKNSSGTYVDKETGLTAAYTLDALNTYGSGTYKITLVTTDWAENFVTEEYVVKLDKEAPTAGTMTMKLDSSSGNTYTNDTWTKHSVYIAKANGSDPKDLTDTTTLSGHLQTTYSVTKNGTDYLLDQTDSNILTEQGTYVITVTTEDKAGVSYSETGNTKTRTYTVKIDKSSPTIKETGGTRVDTMELNITKDNSQTVDYIGTWDEGRTTFTGTWTKQDVNIKLNANISQDALSGIKTDTSPSFIVKKDGVLYNSLQDINSTSTTYTLSHTGTYEIIITLEDKAGVSYSETGNTITQKYIVKIDKDLPTAGTLTMKLDSGTGNSYTNNTWTKHSVYIAKLDGADQTTLSGHLKTTYSVTKDGTNYLSNQTNPNILTEDGEYVITVTTEDKAGESYSETGNTKSNTYTVKIDKSSPTIKETGGTRVDTMELNVTKDNSQTVNYTGTWDTGRTTFTGKWTKHDVKIKLNANISEDALSGIKTATSPSFTVKKDGVLYDSLENINNTSTQYTLSETGTYEIVITLEDKAGETYSEVGNTITQKYIIKIDKENPTVGTITMGLSSGANNYNNDTWVKNSVYIAKVDGSDQTHLSGHLKTTYNVTKYSNYDDYAAGTNGVAHLTNQTAANTLSADGIYVIAITTEDKAGEQFSETGNTTTDNTYIVKIDKTDPIAIITGEATGVTDGLIRYFDANNNQGNAHSNSTTTWTDLAGKNNGTVRGGATFTNAYLTLDGTNDWVNMGTNSITAGNTTLEASIKLNAIDTSKRYILSTLTASGGIGIYVQSGKISVEAYVAGTRYELKFDEILDVNRIYNISVTHDGSNIKLYFDGVCQKTLAASGTLSAGTNLILGANSSGSDNFANIKVYSVRMYNKALTEAQIKQNLNADRISPEKLVASNDSVTVSIVFNEGIQNFTASDITVTNGTKGALTPVESSIIPESGLYSKYTLAVTGITAGQDLGIAVTTSSYEDKADNSGNGPSTTRTRDNVGPSVTSITASDIDYTNAGKEYSNASSITYTIKFNEPVVGFVKEDLSTENGTVTTFTKVSNTEFTAVVTNTGTCKQVVTVPAGAVTDDSGNLNTTLSKEVIIDRTTPTITASAEASINASSEDGKAVKSQTMTLTVEDKGTTAALTALQAGLKSDNVYEYYLSTSENALAGGEWIEYDHTGATSFTIGTGKTGTYYLFVKTVKDNVENVSSTNGNMTALSGYHRFGPYVFDNSKPTITVDKQATTNTSAADGKAVKSQTVKITVADVGTAGVKTEAAGVAAIESMFAYYLSSEQDSITGGIGEWRKYTSGTAFTLEKDKDGNKLTGTYYLFIRTVKDNLGYESSEFVATTTVDGTTYHMCGPYVLDNSAPTITINPNGNNTYKKEQSAVATTEDVGTAGLKANQVRYLWVQGTTAQTDSEILAGTVFGSGNTITKSTGTGNDFYLWAIARDNVGNSYKTSAGPFYLDNTVPTLGTMTSQIASATTYKLNITGFADTTDTVNQSGVRGYLINTTGSTPTAATAWGTASATLTYDKWIPHTTDSLELEVPENTQYYIWVIDNANNISEQYTYTTNEISYALNETSWYETFEEAVDAATSGDTIRLLNSVTDNSDGTIDKNITFNTDGKTLTRNVPITLNSGCSLEVKGSGKITSTSADKATIITSGTFKLSEATIESSNYIGIEAKDTGTVNITGGKVTSLVTTHAALTNSGTGAITISGGTIGNNTEYMAIANTSSANITITGGTLQGCTYTGSGTAEFKGGTINGNIYGGSTKAAVATSNIILQGATVNASIYGGNPKYNVTTSNITLTSGTVGVNVYGGGMAGKAVTTSNITLQGATIKGNIYGGADTSGTVTTANINVSSGKVEKNVYGGSSQGGTTQNANITIQGSASISGNVYGGSEKATFATSSNKGNITINIVGGGIGGSVYGGSEEEVSYVNNININIGKDATGDNSLPINNLEIKGNIYGGGSKADVTTYTTQSVVGTSNINIDGNGYSTFKVHQHIFGSGKNCSVDASNITIKDLGASKNPYSIKSIQRAGTVTVDNANLEIIGISDVANLNPELSFTLNQIGKLTIKNGTTLHLRRGLNRVQEFNSLNASGDKATVTINASGAVTASNTINRVYVYEGVNFIISKEEYIQNQKSSTYGKVSGMTFFGMYARSRSTNALKYDLYDPTSPSNGNLFKVGSYAEGLYDSTGAITVDGFYTNVMNAAGTSIISEYVDVETCAPIYQDWIIGLKTYSKEVTMIAKRNRDRVYQSVPLDYLTEAGVTYNVSVFSINSLEPGITIVDKTLIPVMAPTTEQANTQFALIMSNGSSGWRTEGQTSFYSATGVPSGTTQYITDDSGTAPLMDLYLYNSINIDRDKDCGFVEIIFLVEPSTGGQFRLALTINIQTLNEIGEEVDDEMAFQTESRITAGKNYDLFIEETAYITDRSAMTAAFTVYPLGTFSSGDYRVLSTTYQLPTKTEITMIDLGQGANPKVYYYEVNGYDELKNGNYIYKLSNFKQMGTSTAYANPNSAYTASGYEDYKFIFDFKDANIAADVLGKTIQLDIRNGSTHEPKNDQFNTVSFNIYKNKNTELTLQVNGDTANVYDMVAEGNLKFDVVSGIVKETVVVNSEDVIINDTYFFDKKLGISVSIYDSTGNNRVPYEQIKGTYIKVDGKYYYPDPTGLTRIYLSDTTATVTKSVEVNIGGGLLETGEYKLRIENFVSDNGTFYGLTAENQSDTTIRIIDLEHGLKAEIADEDRLIDNITGKTFAGTDKIMNVNITASDIVDNTNIRVKLYRRDATYNGTGASASYKDISYTHVNLQSYVSNTLVKPADEGLTATSTYEYIVTDEVAENTLIELALNLKANLKTGGYKLSFELFSGDTSLGKIDRHFVITDLVNVP